MVEFKKWLKKTYKNDIPVEYERFLYNDGFLNTNCGEYSFYENGVLQQSDLHCFFKPFGNDCDSIMNVYYTQVQNGIFSKLDLPFGQDSGGNFLCINMGDNKYGAVEFFSHDCGCVLPIYISDNFENFINSLENSAEINENTNTNLLNNSYLTTQTNEINCDSSNEDKEYSEKEFKKFIIDNSMNISIDYIDFMKKYNGLVVDKTIEMRDLKSNIRISVITPLILSYKKVVKMYAEIQSVKKLSKNYIPIVLTTNKRIYFVIKVKSKNVGEVFLYDGIMNDLHCVSKDFKSFMLFLL